MSGRLVRAAVVVVSTAIAAWFAVGVRQAHGIAAAGSIVGGGARVNAASARRATNLLSAAGQLNPDTQVDVLRAQLYLDLGNRPAARRVLERVVKEEPDNAVAWEWLAKASVGDPAEFYLAAFRIDQLVPPVHRQR
jgi:hypothetical protein